MTVKRTALLLGVAVGVALTAGPPPVPAQHRVSLPMAGYRAVPVRGFVPAHRPKALPATNPFAKKDRPARFVPPKKPMRPGYYAKVRVQAPTRLDWAFAESKRSVPVPSPADLKGYDSTQQSYELFVPAGYNPRKPAPLIVFVSAGDDPQGWKAWEKVCRRRGVLFAGPYNAGNSVAITKRSRITLDVLDDVRRRFHVDPDRTYLSGLSGGARHACSIAYALPELFGGVVPVCAGYDLRPEAWLRQRAAERLSVALVSGTGDFNRPEVERLRLPVLRANGIRSRLWVFSGMGHTLPQPGQLDGVFTWLEGALRQRRVLAALFPASRIPPTAAPTADEWSQALLSEAVQRLGQNQTAISGLMQLKGCMKRWPGLAAATDAKQMLREFDAVSPQSWESLGNAEQLRFLYFNARGWDAFATGPLTPVYVEIRDQLAANAVFYWEMVLLLGPDTSAAPEATSRLKVLNKLVGG
jgi:predicted esterase